MPTPANTLRTARPAVSAARLLATLMADRQRWEPLVRFRTGERWYTPILLDEPGVDAWLLTWLPGQRTGLHDHGGSAGAFGVVRGTLREDTVGRAGGRPVLTHRLLPTGGRRPFGPRHLHAIVNDGALPAVSLHVYAPGLTRMTRFRWTADGPSEVTVNRAGADW